MFFSLSAYFRRLRKLKTFRTSLFWRDSFEKPWGINLTKSVLRKFNSVSLAKPSFFAGGSDSFAKYLPPARAANSPPSRPQPIRKSYIENFTKTAGGMVAESGTPGGGGLAVGVQPGRKIFNTLIKKGAAI